MTCPRQALSVHGPTLSRIVFGMWRLSDWALSVAERQALIEHALSLGVTSFDHADIYGNYTAETAFGDVLRATPSLRDRMELVSKCGIRLPARFSVHDYDTSRSHILRSVDASLAALGTDHLDLLLIHRPDPLMNADEMAEAFRLLADSGKVRAFGVSNFTPAQFELLNSRWPLVTNQIECSPLNIAPFFDGSLDQLQRLRLAPMLWSPLGGGRLFADDTDPVASRVRAVLDEQSRRLGISPTQLVYAWLMQHPSRPLPIVGSRRPGVLDDAVAACSVTLERQDWYPLLVAAQGHDVP